MSFKKTFYGECPTGVSIEIANSSVRWLWVEILMTIVYVIVSAVLLYGFDAIKINLIT